jgi:uncharacterized protein (TIGR03790 family)
MVRHAIFLPFLLATSIAGAAPGLQPAQLGVVINDDEPNSVELGEYYRTARGIPEANIVHVRIPGKPRKLTAEQFAKLKDEIDGKLKPDVQAVLMVWTAPYAVECNGITAAYALGFDAEQCAKTCGAGKPSPYFNASAMPAQVQPSMRLAMLLPTESVEEGKALIDRGKAAGFRTPAASAYYLVTSETARNSRAQFFPKAGTIPQRKLTIHTLRDDALEGKRDIMIYQTGKARVDKLDTLQFLPGALADHLTSTGGDLLGDSQMSSLRWLQAGATASYGTVSEPCNFWQKFPNPAVLLRHYAGGSTAIEAYWRSVAWPAQGVFIGEPLAAPYRR